MKNVFGAVLVALSFASVAKAGEVNVDLAAQNCSVARTSVSGNQSTASACATANTLPSVRFDSKEFSLFVDTATAGGTVGASYNVCPGLSLGLKGNSTSAKTAGAETHSSTAGAFVLVKSSVVGGALESTLGGSVAEASAADHDTNSGSLDVKYLLNVGAKNWAPFVGVGANYSDFGNSTNVLTGTGALGVRAKL